MTGAVFRSTALFAAALVIGHMATLWLIPTLIFERAHTLLMERGVGVNSFSLSPQITPQSRQVVRASPDLAYSICRLDVSDGPVKLTVAPWTDYASLSVFTADTTVVFAELADSGGTWTADLKGRGDADIILPSPRAVALIRRLAPDKAAYERVAAIAGDDVCQKQDKQS